MPTKDLHQMAAQLEALQRPGRTGERSKDIALLSRALVQTIRDMDGIAERLQAIEAPEQSK
jgi:hypothetical protein